MNEKYCIVYADGFTNERYYIANTDPVTWSPDILSAKKYYTISQADQDVIGDYRNYKSIKPLKDNGSIAKVYAVEINGKTNDEIRRVVIL